MIVTQIVKSEWDNDAAFREVKWHGGEKSDGTQNAVNATIRMADGTSRTILYGGDYQDDGDNVPGATPPEGVYKYTTDGTNFSTQTQLDVNDTSTSLTSIDLRATPPPKIISIKFTISRISIVPSPFESAIFDSTQFNTQSSPASSEHR